VKNQAFEASVFSQLINFELKTKERPLDEAGGSMVAAITERRLFLEVQIVIKTC
jgi:hypothetical protein